MKRISRIVTAGFLALLSLGLVLGIVSLYGWGGRMEALLMVLGDRVWVTIDAGSPRVLLLLLVPGVFLGAAISLYARRPSE